MANITYNTGGRNRRELFTVEEAQRLEDEVQSENSWLERVIAIAEENDWLVDHVFEQRSHAKRTSKGFPDITAVRGKRIVYIELKSHKGKVTPDQIAWLDRLAAAHLEVYIARPCDRDGVSKLFAPYDGAPIIPEYLSEGKMLWTLVRDAEIKRLPKAMARLLA